MLPRTVSVSEAASMQDPIEHMYSPTISYVLLCSWGFHQLTENTMVNCWLNVSVTRPK